MKILTLKIDCCYWTVWEGGSRNCPQRGSAPYFVLYLKQKMVRIKLEQFLASLVQHIEIISYNFFYFSISLSFSLSLFPSLSIYLYLSIYLSLYLSLSLSLSLFPLLSVNLSLSLALSLSIYISLFLSLSPCYDNIWDKIVVLFRYPIPSFLKYLFN